MSSLLMVIAALCVELSSATKPAQAASPSVSVTPPLGLALDTLFQITVDPCGPNTSKEFYYSDSEDRVHLQTQYGCSYPTQLPAAVDRVGVCATANSNQCSEAVVEVFESVTKMTARSHNVTNSTGPDQDIWDQILEFNSPGIWYILLGPVWGLHFLGCCFGFFRDPSRRKKFITKHHFPMVEGKPCESVDDAEREPDFGELKLPESVRAESFSLFAIIDCADEDEVAACGSRDTGASHAPQASAQDEQQKSLLSASQPQSPLTPASPSRKDRPRPSLNGTPSASALLASVQKTWSEVAASVNLIATYKELLKERLTRRDSPLSPRRTTSARPGPRRQASAVHLVGGGKHKRRVRLDPLMVTPRPFHHRSYGAGQRSYYTVPNQPLWTPSLDLLDRNPPPPPHPPNFTVMNDGAGVGGTPQG